MRVLSDLEQSILRRNARVIRISSFLYGLGLSAVYPGLWLLLRDVGAPLEFYAFTLGAYSLGLTLSSPIFGRLFSVSYRVPVIVATVLTAVSGVIYAVADNMWLIMTMRIVQGIGAGQIALLMSYSAQNSTVSRRTKIIAQLNSSLTLGYVCGPLIATVLGFSPAMTVGGRKLHSVGLNGIVTAISQLAICCLTAGWFRPIHQDLSVELHIRADQRDNYISNSHYISWRESNARIVLFGTGYFIESMVFSAYEMLSVPVGHDIFGWDRVEVGMAWTVVSLICYLAYLIGGSLSRDLSDDILLYTGLMAQSAGLIGLRFWGTSAWGFVVFGVLSLIGYASSSLLFEVLFSKEPNPAEIGLLMGVLNSVAALARIGGPYFFNYVYLTRGFSFIFLALAVISGGLSVTVFCFQYSFRVRVMRNRI